MKFVLGLGAGIKGGRAVPAIMGSFALLRAAGRFGIFEADEDSAIPPFPC